MKVTLRLGSLIDHNLSFIMLMSHAWTMLAVNKKQCIKIWLGSVDTLLPVRLKASLHYWQLKTYSDSVLILC